MDPRSTNVFRPLLSFCGEGGDEERRRYESYQQRDEMSNEKSFVFNFTVKVKWRAAIRIQRSAPVESQRYIIVAFVFRACRIAIYARIMAVEDGGGESITS